MTQLRNLLFVSYARSQQFGQYTKRNPAIIDDNNLYKKVVGKNIRVLFSQGKDRQINKHYTFQGNLRNGIHGQGNGHGHHGSHHSHGGGHGGFAYSAEPQHYPAPGVGGVSQTPIDGFHAHNAAFSSLAPGGGGGSGGVHHTGFSSSSGPSTGFTFTGSSGGTGYGSIPSGLRTAGNTHSANQVSQFPASQPSGGNFVQSGGYQNSLGPTHDGFGNTGSSLSTGLPHVVFPENNHISFPADFPTRGQVTNHIITSNNGFQQSSTYNVVPVASSGSNAGFYNPSRPKKEVNDNNSVSTQIKLVHDEFFLPSTWPKQILKRNSATAEGVTTKAFQKSVFSHTLGPELVAAVDSNSLVLGQAQPAAQLPQSLRNDDDSNDQELQTNGSYQPGWHAPHEASSSYPSSRESPVGHQRPSGAALPHLTGPTKGHTRRPRPQTLRKGRSWKSKQSSLSSRMKRLKENLSLKNLVDRFRSLFYQTTTKKRRGINI